MHLKGDSGGSVLYLKALLKFPVLSEHQQRVGFLKRCIRSYGEVQDSAMPHSDDIDAVFFSDIDPADTHADPLRREVHLIDVVITFQIYKIEDVVGTEADRCPFRKLLFRVDDLIGTVSQKKFLVNVTGSAGDNELCSELL